VLQTYVQGSALVCVDAANLESAVKDLGWYIDYRKVMHLFDPKHLAHIRYYCVRHDAQNQDGFFTVLKRLGYDLVTKPLKKIKSLDAVGGHVRKANFDVEIAVDALLLLAEYTTLVLFSGDSDFAYLVRVLRSRGKHVVVISTKNHISRELIAASHKYVDLRHIRSVISRSARKSPSFATGS
jgi:uncharacterized LabA/DUF88 family protein